MNNEHSNVLKLVTVKEYSMDKMLDIMTHSEVTSKTGPQIWKALDSAHLSLSGFKSRITATIITMKEKLKSFTKHPTETLTSYHTRFNTHLDLLLENKVHPGEPQEIALYFLNGTNLGPVIDDLHKDYVMRNKEPLNQ